MESNTAAVVVPTVYATARDRPAPALGEVVESYLAAALDSPHTQRAYRRHVRGQLAALGASSVAEFAALTGAQLANHRARVMTNGLAPKSQSLELGALRSFLTWTRAMGVHRLPAEVVGVALRSPRSTTVTPFQVLTEPEVAAILAAAPTTRDLALLAVMLGGGLRVAEVVALDVGDVLEDQEGQTALHVRQGKGRKDRIVPVQPEVARVIRASLAEENRHTGDKGALFLSRDRWTAKTGRSRLNPRSVWYRVRMTAAAAGILGKRVSPHALRHTYAIRALRSGGNIVAVSKLLGHANIATTQRYVDHLQLGELRAAVPPLPI